MKLSFARFLSFSLALFLLGGLAGLLFEKARHLPPHPVWTREWQVDDKKKEEMKALLDRHFAEMSKARREVSEQRKALLEGLGSELTSNQELDAQFDVLLDKQLQLRRLQFQTIKEIRAVVGAKKILLFQEHLEQPDVSAQPPPPRLE